MPVIQTSTGPEFDDVISAMSHQFLRKSDALGHRVHVSAQIGVWEGDMREGEGRAASQFAADADLRGGHGESGAFVNDAGIDSEQFSGADETAHLGFLDCAQKRHALEFRQRDQEPARRLSHRLDQQDTRHDRVAGKVTFEDRAFGGNLRLGRDGAFTDIEVDDAVNQTEIFELHGGRLGALGRDQFVDARAEVFQDEILLGRRLAVVDLLGPLLERQLDAERLIVDRVAFRGDRVARDVAGFSDNRGDLIEC